ncbi:formylmethanofuran dehydrogenase subunit B [Rhodoligotrophos appendicifer]|uniref:tungsten formylmethanofuran dehydrogenase n=1 Tax=Rhodoligotrophos appendicifer TaxID=987056 RepID=UPI001185F9D2|nr:tungsten formylmethanofuran dehydrogenase [Rhodoligotrophos appendicifer]
MAEAFIGGRRVSLAKAVDQAASLLERAKLPVVTGLGTDTAGLRMAASLARRLSCVIDPAGSGDLLNNLDVLRSTGWMIVSPGEARHRADLFMVIGAGALSAWPEMIDQLMPDATTARIITVGAPDVEGALASRGPEPLRLAASEKTLPGVVAALRARHTGHPISLGDQATASTDALVEALTAARFGVVIWPPGLASPVVEMICGLVKDLNAKTRFSGIPIPARGNGSGVGQSLGWLTGFPTGISFGSGLPAHDPWAHDAERLIASGEADAAVWVEAYGAQGPDWVSRIPTVALVPSGTLFSKTPAVRIDIGTPGIDHDGVDLRAGSGALAFIEASRPSPEPSAHAILTALLDRLGGPS